MADAGTEGRRPKPTMRKLQGVSLTGEAWKGFDYEPYKPVPSRSQRLLEFHMMQQFDPTVGAGLYIIQRMIVNALGRYEHPDENVTKFVNDALAEIEGGLDLLVGRMLTAIGYGVAVAEMTWKEQGLQWLIDRVELLHPLTYARDLHTGVIGVGLDRKEAISLDPKTQRVEEVIQFSGKVGEDPKHLLINQLVYWPYNATFREDVYGNSALEKVRRSWYAKTKMETYWNILMEKWAVPVPFLLVPQGSYYEDPESGDKLEFADFMKGLLENLVAGQGVVLAVDENDAKLFDMKLFESTRGGSAEFDKVCLYWDRQVFKGILLPRLLVEEPEHATRAQADVNLRFFFLMLASIRKELYNVILQQIVARLLLYNFGPNVPLGEWIGDDFQAEDIEAMARTFLMIEQAQASAVTAGINVEPDMHKARTEWGSSVLASPDEIEEQLTEGVQGRAAEEAAEVLSRYGS